MFLPGTVSERWERYIEVITVLINVHVHGTIISFRGRERFDLTPFEFPSMNSWRGTLLLGMFQNVRENHIVLVDGHVRGSELLK